ncbi:MULTISPECIES: 30S ribosomal protein S3 [Shewanella]|uniref:Small ribosomal subunit protein uS3 n=2 Tax=Shewanella TaxID=22 RepID=RS3_SHEAM|nr:MULTISPECIES: 30S ribosomal protein S3 [Shewanella]A1S224.1 RecName: Full=Small ribosomal subunit protein uS3; AltName: Full=30S ribosomal protein S3 [Shewanella amazonensis SB2B]ABL98430.1 SSU ribosomal protein S3P [Shewanella amazonensis SB2B]MCL2920075.1 30S ribosomal protein S3 [Shewanella litorisediminis]QRH02054.1 30S ribosomal protein S3 [Shewanella litorisediminis]QYJ75630.1 30S ribosomal protein S3 [Shewanella sp. FJAT-52076]QYK05491.1 30S ribosomal protein S3 [Shewanella zhangzho
MGQKVHPNGIRLGITKPWISTWYADKSDYANNLHSDWEVRKFLEKKLEAASVSKIVIERPAKSIRVTIHTARPGVVIGKKGEDVEVLRAEVAKISGTPAQINIAEIRKPELDAKLVADSIAQQLERRVMFRRAMKRAVQNAMRIGAQGIKVEVSGRLGGAEIARTEWYREGRVPLHTLRADIDYATSESHTTYGVIGIKVWVFKGEVLDGMLPQVEEPKQQQPKRKPRGK